MVSYVQVFNAPGMYVRLPRAKIGADCQALFLHFLLKINNNMVVVALHAVQGQALFNGGESVGVNLDQQDTGK